MSEEDFNAKTELVHVVVLDGSSCRHGLLNEDIALTLIGAATESAFPNRRLPKPNRRKHTSSAS